MIRIWYHRHFPSRHGIRTRVRNAVRVNCDEVVCGIATEMSDASIAKHLTWDMKQIVMIMFGLTTQRSFVNDGCHGVLVPGKSSVTSSAVIIPLKTHFMYGTIDIPTTCDVSLNHYPLKRSSYSSSYRFASNKTLRLANQSLQVPGIRNEY